MRSVRVVALGLVLATACSAGPTVSSPPPADPHTDPSTLPTGVTPAGGCAVPTGAGPEDVATPAAVVGTGTKESCTGERFVTAVEQTPGVITFDCGPDPVTLTVPRTARVFNRVGGRDVQRVVIDGGGKVTLSGA